MISFIQNLDIRIIQLTEKYLKSENIQEFFSFITKLNDYGLLTILVVALIVIQYKDPKITKICIYSTVISLIMVQLMMKNIIQRPRPFEIINSLDIIIKKPITPSFPSGHASISGIGFMLSYLYFNKKLVKYFFMILFLSIAISRLVLEVHFFSDVVVGFSIAILIVNIVYSLINKGINW